jgi:hypothetical protein
MGLIPKELLNADKLSQQVYDTWVRLLKDKRLVDDLVLWTDLDDEWREMFIKSMRTNIVIDLEYIDSLGSPVDDGSPKNHSCYVCGQNPVTYPGDVCRSCCFF